MLRVDARMSKKWLLEHSNARRRWARGDVVQEGSVGNGAGDKARNAQVSAGLFESHHAARCCRNAQRTTPIGTLGSAEQTASHLHRGTAGRPARGRARMQRI